MNYQVREPVFGAAMVGSYSRFLEVYSPEKASLRISTGDTLLMLALSNSDPDASVAIANTLLDDGANPAERAQDLAPLHNLFGRGLFDMNTMPVLLSRLLSLGADVNAIAPRYGTPLQTLMGNLGFDDEYLACFYDILFALPDLDLLVPGKRRRSTLESARLAGQRRAGLYARMLAYLAEHKIEEAGQ